MCVARMKLISERKCLATTNLISLALLITSQSAQCCHYWDKKTLRGFKANHQAYGIVDGYDLDKCGRTPLVTWPNEWLNSFCAHRIRKLRRSHSKRISQGYAIRPGEFPSYVELMFRGPGVEIQCGGVLVGPDRVLTSASCLVDGVNSGRARLGLVDSSQEDPEVQVRFVSNFCKMSGYLSDLYEPLYDVGLVQLMEPAEFTDRVQPACISRQELSPNAVCLAVGNGFQDNMGPASAKVVALPMSRNCTYPNLDLESRDCYSSHFDTIMGVPCLGDWGGPMYCMDRCDSGRPTGDSVARQFVVGLASFSFGGSYGCQSHVKQDVIYASLMKLGAQLGKLFESCRGVRDTIGSYKAGKKSVLNGGWHDTEFKENKA